MELKDLVGEHFLDGVDFSNEQIKTWGDQFENCQVMRFRLDGIVYTAIEDPSDGYRSSMRDIEAGAVPINNTFQAVRVVARHREKSRYGTDDVLELIDVGTGQTVIEVGTSDIDDYYPGFVAFFNPKAMTLNKEQEN